MPNPKPTRGDARQGAGRTETEIRLNKTPHPRFQTLMNASLSPAPPVKVIFRKFRSGGDVLAIFPEVPHDTQAGHCLSYAQVGQHGCASVFLTSVHTSPAKPEDYADLKAELERIGYTLEVRKVRTAAMDAARREAIREFLAAV